MGMHIILTYILVHFWLQSNAEIINGSSYDYIIVGGGSSGATLAARLSERNVTVLLLNAGGTPTDELKYQSIQFVGTSWNDVWYYPTLEQKHACLGQKDKKCKCLASKLLGGGSSINDQIYARGNRFDFDQWDVKGWSYEDVLYYFKKSEGNVIKDVDSGYHGAYGPLSVSQPTYVTPLQEAYIESAKQMGLKVVDYNGKQQLGVGKSQFTLRNGARCSTEKAFLRPAYGRKNLKVLANATVVKILFELKKAKEVEFDFNGERHIARSKKEIILSAGVYNSPKILLLSGIGPRQHLKALGIEVIVDLPGVGNNLRDHIGTAELFTINTTDSINRNRLDFNDSLAKFQKGLGPFTTNGNEAIVFHKSKYEENKDYPDIEIAYVSESFDFKSSPYNEKISEFLKQFDGKESFIATPTCLHSKSTGRIKLNSSNPYDKPIIDYQHLSNDHDIQVLITAVKKAIELAESEPLRRFGVEQVFKRVPGCGQFEYDTDEYWTCRVKLLSMMFFHAVGTCKMGQDSDQDAVVDRYLKVRGVKGLRVADCSIIPKTISGHTNAVAIMIGEKVADLIISDAI